MIELKEIVQFMDKNLTGAGIAWVWWLIHYVYKLNKNEVFSFTKLVINIILAWWIWFLCQKLWLSEVYISIAWFCTYPLLNLIELKWPAIIKEILLNK